MIYGRLQLCAAVLKTSSWRPVYGSGRRLTLTMPMLCEPP